MWALVDFPGARPRIFNYSPEYLDLPGHCKHMFVGSLMIKIIRSFSQEAIKYHKHFSIPGKYMSRVCPID